MACVIAAYPGHQPIGIVYRFDRVIVALDRPPLPGPVDLVRAECLGGLEVVPRIVPFTPYQCKLDLFQPSRGALKILVEDCMGPTVAGAVIYAEIACDFVFKTKKRARAFQRWLAERLIVAHQRDRVLKDHQIYYFARRADPKGNKRGRVAVLYADRPTKLNSPFAGRLDASGKLDGSGKPCAHLEFRFTGSPELAEVGIAAVSDLTKFDHVGFWRSAVSLHELSSPTELGRLLGGTTGTEVSGTALRKRALKFIGDCTSGGLFFMQNAVRSKPMLRRKFKAIPIESVMLKEAESRY